MRMSVSYSVRQNGLHQLGGVGFGDTEDTYVLLNIASDHRQIGFLDPQLRQMRRRADFVVLGLQRCDAL